MKNYLLFQMRVFMQIIINSFDNIDLKSTPEGLGKKFEVNILARKSPRKRFHQQVKKIELFNNIFHIYTQQLMQQNIKKLNF